MAGGDDSDWWRRQTVDGAPTLVDGALMVHEDGTRAITEGLGQGSFGHVIWDAALSLATFFRWLHSSGKLNVTALRCLELGSGTGVAGLTLAQLGAERVVLTDNDDDVLELMRRNVKLNELEHNISCALLDWSDHSTWLTSTHDRFDVVQVEESTV